MDDILEKLPEEFNMAEIMQKTSNRSPYVLVCFQECERMNILLREIRVSLQQLDLGWKVSLKVVPEQVFPHWRALTMWPLFSMQGGADVISWHGSPAVPAELWHSARRLEQTGVSIYLRPGPLVSNPLPAPTGLSPPGRWFSILSYCCVRRTVKAILYEYFGAVLCIIVHTTTICSWVSFVGCSKGKNQWKIRWKSGSKQGVTAPYLLAI